MARENGQQNRRPVRDTSPMACAKRTARGRFESRKTVRRSVDVFYYSDRRRRVFSPLRTVSPTTNERFTGETSGRSGYESSVDMVRLLRDVRKKLSYTATVNGRERGTRFHIANMVYGDRSSRPIRGTRGRQRAAERTRCSGRHARTTSNEPARPRGIDFDRSRAPAVRDLARIVDRVPRLYPTGVNPIGRRARARYTKRYENATKSTRSVHRNRPGGREKASGLRRSDFRSLCTTPYTDANGSTNDAVAIVTGRTRLKRRPGFIVERRERK